MFHALARVKKYFADKKRRRPNRHADQRGPRERLPTRYLLRPTYLRDMRFEPAIPTRGTKVPATPEWI
jgi:hypothetical protein